MRDATSIAGTGVEPGIAPVLAGAPIAPPAADLLRRFPSVEDLERHARRRIPKRLGGYVFGGADSEAGLIENRRAFERIQLLPRYGTDVMQRSTEIAFFGRRWGAPIGVSPVGLMGSLWPGSEHALAAAAAKARVPFALSTFSANALETIAPIAGESAWFQLYAVRNLDVTHDLVRRADKAGYKALVITLDAPVHSKRPKDIRNGFEFPPRVSAGFLWEIARCPAWALGAMQLGYPAHGSLLAYVPPGVLRPASLYYIPEGTGIFSITWDDVAAIRKLWHGPLIIKGLQHPDDAAIAVAKGADGIIVSNHGGRQLDAAPAAITSLSAIVERAGKQATILLDSGVRCGLDVAKTLVRGGHCAMSGRSFIAACAAIGTARGADYAMALFAHEVSLALAQLGVRTCDELRACPGYEHASPLPL
jgi:(S)-mandelate dehydrogenase